MIQQDIYKQVLIQPALTGADELFIVSGYASATFALRHIRKIKELKLDCVLNLIIGMPSDRSDHLAYLNIASKYPGQFNGFYLESAPVVHCKTYGWYKDTEPFVGYAGSANYSQNGFSPAVQLNQISSACPALIKNLYSALLPRCVSFDDYVPPVKLQNNALSRLLAGTACAAPGKINWETDTRVRVSFLTNHGVLPARSGLNWGQRPEMGREPNQAYLSLKKDARKEGFLPPLAYSFSLLTDDNQAIDCVVAQQGRKAIHSTTDNSELGRYFRDRLGVPHGAPVTVDHLIAYGRTDYTIEKVNEETFLLDFSV